MECDEICYLGRFHKYVKFESSAVSFGIQVLLVIMLSNKVIDYQCFEGFTVFIAIVLRSHCYSTTQKT
jgi:hypothetical protein